MQQRILVIGATGLLGEPVARSMLDAGFSVRVMSRHADHARRTFPRPFEVAAGDALHRDDVERALADCDAVHISVDHDREDECVTRVVEAARGQGVDRISYVSGTTVCEENRWFPLVDRKLKSEHAIMDSGIAYTILCPGWFMEMLARLVRDGRAIMFGKARRSWHLVTVHDFARMVTESYRRPEAANRRFYVHGPQALTVPEALRSYCRALHPEIESIVHIPIWLARLIARARRNAAMRAGIDMVAYLERVGERGDPAEANAILGAPGTILDEWLQTAKDDRRDSALAGSRS
jgi:uncharacterized protein YbjT (DUF2867 family)